MHLLDWVVIAAYMVGTVVFGAWISRDQTDVRDYFVSGRTVPWWAVTGSIVATETSTVTFISVPGYAFGGDFTFLQLAAGYLIGRVVISVLFIPAYFRGELLTVYQLLGSRFGGRMKRLASALFLVTRSLSDGFRLFATGLVLAALISGVPSQSVLIVSVLVMGAATIAYTYLGGMTAVIWTDVVQLVIYLVGAVAAAAVLINIIPGGWPEVAATASAAGKFRVFDWTWSLTKGYTFWSGIIGGAFLTTATHGTDQLMVQRYLCSRSANEARVSLLTSGVVVFVQFVLFLVIGAMLYVFYLHAPGELSSITVAGHVQTDRVFPQFIVSHLPPGLSGLVVAAIFAAAMSTLSSSLNSSAAAAYGDFYLPLRGGSGGSADLAVSRTLTAVWGVVQIVVALIAISFSKRVVDEVLGIASFTNGVILGIFLLGTLTRVGQRAAFAGALTGAAVMLAVKLATPVSWQWYVLIGSVATFAAGIAAGRVLNEAETLDPR
jgi:SSS family transporter